MEKSIGLILNQAPFLVICALLFALVEYLRPFGKRPPWKSEAFSTDLSYFIWALTLRTPFLYWLFTNYEVLLLTRFPGMTSRRIAIAAWPLWIQAFVVLLLVDFLYYFAHRPLHSRILWRFHAAHHVPEHLGWMSAFRLHPMESFTKRFVPFTILAPLGFSAEAGILAGLATALFGYVGHSNVSWDFGPFRKLFVSPLFHRFHHSREIPGKNLGGVFSCWDMIFGTYYLPELKRAEDLPLGIEEKLPEGFWRQTWHGFAGAWPRPNADG